MSVKRKRNVIDEEDLRCQKEETQTFNYVMKFVRWWSSGMAKRPSGSAPNARTVYVSIIQHVTKDVFPTVLIDLIYTYLFACSGELLISGREVAWKLWLVDDIFMGLSSEDPHGGSDLDWCYQAREVLTWSEIPQYSQHDKEFVRFKVDASSPNHTKKSLLCSMLDGHRMSVFDASRNYVKWSPSGSGITFFVID
jgi:hypothetical protein